MNAVVETRGLCKQYGPALRVNHLDLTVPEGAVYGISGPQRGRANPPPSSASGAGRPTAGEIAVFGRPHGSPHPHGDSQSGGQPDREPQLLRPPDRRGEPAHRPNPARGAGAGHRGGAAHRPAGRPEGQADGPLLPGHEAAAGPGRRPAGLPQAADPGRAHQRPGIRRASRRCGSSSAPCPAGSA